MSGSTGDVLDGWFDTGELIARLPAPSTLRGVLSTKGPNGRRGADIDPRHHAVVRSR
ncbi:MAG: hypothetical protein R2697_19715 [Ilumatobacteraceae bacterium]